MNGDGVHGLPPLRVVQVVNRASRTTVPWRMAKRMRDRGVDVSTLSWYENGGGDGLGARYWWDTAAARRLVRRLRDTKPDVVHLHHTASAAIGAVAARLANDPATVKSEHSSRARKRANQYVLDLVSLSLSDAVVANSDSTLASFRSWERRITRDKRLRIYNGVDLAAIDDARNDASPRAAVEREERVVVSVARLVPEKNYSRLLRAIRIAVDRGTSSFRLVLVGDGELRPALEKQARQLELTDRVDFRGELAAEDVYRQLWRSELFVIPSLSEGFCNAAVEAMAVGLPVAASDVPALREVVGENAWFFDPHSPESIADAFREALSAPQERRQRRGASLRERARSRYSLSRTVTEHLRLYRRLTGRRESGGGP